MGTKIKWRKPKKIRNDVISTAKARGYELQFWHALMVGDEITVVGIADDPESSHVINAIYDTSNIDEWKTHRLNYRSLSRSRSHPFAYELVDAQTDKIAR